MCWCLFACRFFCDHGVAEDVTPWLRKMLTCHLPILGSSDLQPAFKPAYSGRWSNTEPWPTLEQGTTDDELRRQHEAVCQAVLQWPGSRVLISLQYPHLCRQSDN